MDDHRSEQLTAALARASAIVSEAVQTAQKIVAETEIEAEPWEVCGEILSLLHDDLTAAPPDPVAAVERRWTAPPSPTPQ